MTYTRRDQEDHDQFIADFTFCPIDYPSGTCSLCEPLLDNED